MARDPLFINHTSPVANGMSRRLWCMLYRPFHLLADSGDAAWEACRRALRATEPGQPLPDLRPAGAPCGLRQPAPFRGDVRQYQRPGIRHPGGARACHRPRSRYPRPYLITSSSNPLSPIEHRKATLYSRDPQWALPEESHGKSHPAWLSLSGIQSPIENPKAIIYLIDPTMLDASRNAAKAQRRGLSLRLRGFAWVFFKDWLLRVAQVYSCQSKI